MLIKLMRKALSFKRYLKRNENRSFYQLKTQRRPH